MEKEIKVMCVDDHKSYTDGIESLFQTHELINIVGSVHDVNHVVLGIERLNPDVILMDLKMNNNEFAGVELTQKIKQKFPEKKVIVLSQFDQNKYIVKSRQAGADGYLLKNCGYMDIITSIQKVHKGDEYFGPFVSNIIFKEYFKKQENGKGEKQKIHKYEDFHITKREFEVLNYVKNGESYATIAGHLYVSENTIKSHIHSLLTKTNSKNRLQLINWAQENNLFD